MRTASAGRGLVRGSLVMMKRTPGVMRAESRVAGGRSVETHETVRAGDHIVQDAQAAERGLFARRDVAALRAIRAGEQFQAVRLELGQTRVVEALDRFVDAVEVNVHAERQRRFRQANAVGEVRMAGGSGDQHAQLLIGQQHAVSIVAHFINTTTFAARDFWPRRGASDAHTLQRSVRSEQRRLGRKAPPPGGLRRFSVLASLLLGHSPLRGMLPRRASPEPKIDATNVVVFMKWGTKRALEP